MSVLYSSDLKDTLAQDDAVTAQELRQCLEQPAKTIQTSLGLAEYAENGEGPVLLAMHGGPGGYDQGLVLGELFRKNGFKVIAPSRPGYLGTPLASGKSAGDQGDFAAALLDALEIPQAFILGASGGGPAAYQIAQRHPEKTKALLVIDGISMNYTKGQDISKTEEFVYLSKPGQWLMGFFFKHFPASVVKGFLQTESTLEKHELGERVKEIVQDEAKFEIIAAMFTTMTRRFPERKEGAANDIAMGAAIDKLPLDNIQCPTLIIHADKDNDVPPRDAEYAHTSIPGSQLLWIHQGSHIGFWTAPDAPKVQKYALQWLKGV